MGSTLSVLYCHLVFSTTYHQPLDKSSVAVRPLSYSEYDEKYLVSGHILAPLQGANLLLPLPVVFADSDHRLLSCTSTRCLPRTQVRGSFMSSLLSRTALPLLLWIHRT